MRSRPNFRVAVRAGAALVAAVLAVGCRQGGPSAPAADLEWPQWRGSSGLGLSANEDLPVTWSAEGDGIRWSRELAAGTSSPIVAGERVFLTTGEREGREVVLKVASLDFESGETVWETQVATRPREKVHRIHSSAGPTPATDGKMVVAYFGSHLAALDMAGKILWNREIDPQFVEESHYGAGSSPILVGDQIIIFRDRELVEDDLVGWIGAFDKATGEPRWRDTWDNTCCSYTTPILRQTATDLEMIVLQAGGAVAYDPEDGTELWRLSAVINQPVANPVLEGNLLCLASGAHGVREAMCFDLTNAENGKPKDEPLWRSTRGVPSTASPILVDGSFYLLNEKGVLVAIKARSGRRVWQKRLSRGNYYSSLVAGDGKLYAISSGGEVTVVRSDGKVLAKNGLPMAGIVSSPALADGSLLIRAKGGLVRIDGTPPPAS